MLNGKARPVSKLVVNLFMLIFLVSCGGGNPVPDNKVDFPPSDDGQVDDPDSTPSTKVEVYAPITAINEATRARPIFGSNIRQYVTNDVEADCSECRSIRSPVRPVANSAVFTNDPNRVFDDYVTLASDGRSEYVVVGVTSELNLNDLGDWVRTGYNLNIANGVGSADVFVEGPEIDRSSDTFQLPASGSATYKGIARGLFAYDGGSSSGFGNYAGNFKAEANFVEKMISGSIEDINPSLAFVNGEPQMNHEGDFPYGAVIVFVGGSINDDGEVTGQVELRLPGRTISGQSGQWGSRLSSISDSNGDPRLIAGTHGVTARTVDGITMGFLGTHLGVVPSFRQQ